MPAPASKPQKAPPIPRKATPEAAIKKQIMIVDDDAPVRMVVQACLELDGRWEVLPAASGQQGLDIARAVPLDVILLDVIMPEMDGFTFLKRLLSLPTTYPVPVILLTATAHLVDPKQAEQLGIVGTIAKPFEPLSLANQILEILKLS